MYALQPRSLCTPHSTQHCQQGEGKGQLRPHLLLEASNLKVHICTETKQLYNLLQHSEALYGRGHHRWHGERRGKGDRPVLSTGASPGPSSWKKLPQPAAKCHARRHLQQRVSAASHFYRPLTCAMAGNRPPEAPEGPLAQACIVFWPVSSCTWRLT